MFRQYTVTSRQGRPIFKLRLLRTVKPFSTVFLNFPSFLSMVTIIKVTDFIESSESGPSEQVSSLFPEWSSMNGILL